MITRILNNILLWIYMKSLLLVASFYFVRNMNKNLKSVNSNVLKGENLIKNKDVTSGSIDLIEDTNDDLDEYTSVDDMKIDVQEIELALKKLLDKDHNESLDLVDSLPIFVVKIDNDKEFFFSVSRKTLVQVRNGTEVFPLFEDKKRQKIVPGFYVIDNEVFNIDPKKVVCLGWN